MSTAAKTSDYLGDIQMFIDGQWVDSVTGKRVEVENPSNEEIIGSIPDGNEEDAEIALASAQRAAAAWAAMPAVERGNLLIKLADLIKANRERLARILSIEMGKTYQLALGEVDVSADFINFPAQAARQPLP